MSRTPNSGSMGRLVDKIKRTISDQDETRDPLTYGYQRVNTGETATTSDGTTLESVVLDTNAEDLTTTPRIQKQRSFSPVLDNEKNPFIEKPEKSPQRSKVSLKNSKVSFSGEDEDDKFDIDDVDFSSKRAHFQKNKSLSTSSQHKSILIKELRTLLNNDARRQFQHRKHVSLDVKSAKQLEDLLKASSSSEEFEEHRKNFQERKHKSLDARHIKFEKEDSVEADSSDDELRDTFKTSLLKIDSDITKPIVIDLKDLDSSSDEEDFQTNRALFQQSKTFSTDSRRSGKSVRFYEMQLTDKDVEGYVRPVPFVRQITEEGKPKLEVYRPTTNPIYIYSQVLAAFAVSLGSMVVGFSSAYTSPALVSMKDRNITAFDVSDDEGSWVGGLMPLAGLAGGILGGPLIEYLGRKNTILSTAVPFIVSWLLIATAVNIGMVFAGRAISGFCVGIASLSLPVYLGETVQPEVRGTLGLLPTALGNIGILLCYVTGKYMNWYQLAYLGAAMPVPFLVLMLLIPETPRWYVSRNKEENARKALQWLRGRKADVEPELKGIMKSHMDAERTASKSALLDLLKKSNLKPLLISLGLMFFQQFSGINVVIFYTVSIFKDAGSTIDENLCTIIVGIVNFIAVFIATVLIDRLGRKILLYISDCAMVVTLFTLGTFFYLKNSGADVSNIGWLPLASTILYVLGFSLGFGPIPWLMMGEILPGKIRGSAASVATAFNWTCTFIVTKSFNDLVAVIGQHGAFWLFGSVCVFALFFVIFYVPETQGKSLEDIERKMMGRVRRMSSMANIKPLSFNM